MISTLTINTAIDRQLFIQAFHRNQTNRIKRIEDVLGGKGTHVSLNLSRLGIESRCFGIAMGETGRKVIGMLQECGNVDVRMLYGERAESRTNYAIIEDDHSCTLVTEKGPTATLAECDELLALMEGELASGDYLVLSGDASNTEIPFFYNTVMQRLEGRGIRFVVDTSSENLIHALQAKPFLVKPNLDELSQVVGRPVDTQEEIVHAMRHIAEMGVEIVAVSCGDRGSYVLRGGDLYRVHPLKVNVVNTIGCGDAYLAGLLYGLEKERELPDVLRIATAVSAAAAESDLTVGFDLERAGALESSVEIERI